MTTLQPTLAIFDIGGPEVLMVMFLVLLLFGGKKLPELARGLGKSVREFKKATAGVEEEIKRAINETSATIHSKPPTSPKSDATPSPAAAPSNPFLAPPYSPPPPPPDKPAGS